MRQSPIRIPLLAAALATAAASPSQAVQASPGEVAPPVVGTGTLIMERVVAGDTSKSYAVFLPPDHGSGRRWPALVLMDPRGRALVPLERFRAAAADLGYVVLSSYDTSSDEPTSAEDTRAAVEAILNDAADRFALDLRRLHLIGFSGTARVAWAMALGAPDLFPAIVGFGGGIPPRVSMLMAAERRTRPAFFGGAGLRDFNYAEMWITDARLGEQGVPAALAFFDDGHAWAPAAIATAAVEWLELRAVAEGIANRDAAWVRGLFDRDRVAAAALERDGRTHDALLRVTRLVRSFDGLDEQLGPALDSARADVARLARDRTVRRTTERLDRWMAWEREQIDRSGPILSAPDALRPGEARSLARSLRIPELHEQTRDADTLAVQAAQRVLASLHVHAAFYLPRRFLAEGDTARAIGAIELAGAIDPEGQGGCLWLAQLTAGWRERARALRERCSVNRDR